MRSVRIAIITVLANTAVACWLWHSLSSSHQHMEWRLFVAIASVPGFALILLRRVVPQLRCNPTLPFLTQIGFVTLFWLLASIVIFPGGITQYRQIAKIMLHERWFYVYSVRNTLPEEGYSVEIHTRDLIPPLLPPMPISATRLHSLSGERLYPGLHDEGLRSVPKVMRAKFELPSKATFKFENGAVKDLPFERITSYIIGATQVSCDSDSLMHLEESLPALYSPGSFRIACIRQNKSDQSDEQWGENWTFYADGVKRSRSESEGTVFTGTSVFWRHSGEIEKQTQHK